jgi:hypothetical protein
MQLRAHMMAYQVHIAGPLDPRLSDWFDGLTVQPGAAGEDVLFTPPIDQAGLRGILTTLFNLNIRVIAVLPRLDNAAAASRSPSASRAKGQGAPPAHPC